MFWNLARSLASRGHEVHVITQRVRGERDSETRSGVRIRRVGWPAEYAGALTTGFKDSFAYCVGAFFAGISIAAKRRSRRDSLQHLRPSPSRSTVRIFTSQKACDDCARCLLAEPTLVLESMV